MSQRPPTVRVQKLWDPFLRTFHWLLAALVISAWLLGEYGPTKMTLHFWCGYAVGGLLIFRLIWGVTGPKPARFSHFLRKPNVIAAYTRSVFLRKPSYWPGHNPIGALSVIAMLALLAAQVSTGLISDPEDYVNAGPFVKYVSKDAATSAPYWHSIGAYFILFLVLLHIITIIFYRLWKREDLVTPLITGYKKVIDDQ